MRRLNRALALSMTLAAAPLAHATEGGLGRSISGTSVQEDGGVIPDVPVWILNLSTIYQDASIGAGHQVPIVGEVSAGIHSDLSLTVATLLKVWNTGPGQWNFASGMSLPYDWNKITARIGTSQTTLASETESASSLFDLMFTPISAGYHISKTEHVSFALNVWAPTGEYDKTRLANPSLNNWTFVPTVSYTKMLPEQGLQIDGSLGIQFYTRNQATDYQNAPVLSLDTMIVKQFGGVGVGVVVGWIEQLGADTGPTADRLNGFEGYDVSIGPYVSYATKIAGKMPLSMGLRWVPTIASKNRVNGDTVVASVTAIF